MDLAEYQWRAGQTAIYPGRDTIVGLTYLALGVNGEAGEIAEAIKKAWRDDDGSITTERREQILKEVGDALWYLSQICEELGETLDSVAKQNLVKLADRQKRGVLAGSGDNR